MSSSGVVLWVWYDCAEDLLVKEGSFFIFLFLGRKENNQALETVL